MPLPPVPPLTPPLAPHVPLWHKLTTPLYSRISEDPAVWEPAYQPPCLRGGSPKLSPPLIPKPAMSSTPLKRKREPLEIPSELLPLKKTSSPFLSLLLATQSQSTPPPPMPMLKFKTQSSKPSCASVPPPAQKLGDRSKMTSKILKSHWALLTASEKAGLHRKMLDVHSYSGHSIVYGSTPHNSFSTTHDENLTANSQWARTSSAWSSPASPHLPDSRHTGKNISCIRSIRSCFYKH